MITGEEDRMTKTLSELLSIAPGMPNGINFEKTNYGGIKKELSMVYKDTFISHANVSGDLGPEFMFGERTSRIPSYLEKAITNKCSIFEF